MMATKIQHLSAATTRYDQAAATTTSTNDANLKVMSLDSGVDGGETKLFDATEIPKLHAVR